MANKSLKVNAKLSLGVRIVKVLISHDFPPLFKKHAYFTDIT